MINIKRILVGQLESCCYFVSIKNSKNVVIIDPGGDPDTLIKYCQDNELKPSLLINTHGHGDHIGANLELKKVFPSIEICIHVDDEPMLTNEYLNLSLLGGKRYKSPPADSVLKDNEKILFDCGVEFSVIHLPGHTKGSICLYYYAETSKQTPILFSGDSLFKKGVGRTDLPNGNYEDLIDGIKEKLFTLNENTIVYPGHGDSTTILSERNENPFFNSLAIL